MKFAYVIIMLLMSGWQIQKVMANSPPISRYELSREKFDQRWSFRLHTSHFSYYEPEVMSEAGTFYGFEVQWMRELLTKSDLDLQISYEYVSGRIQYEGSLISLDDPSAKPIPHQTHGDDLISDVRFAIIKSFGGMSSRYRLKSYGGFAYRFLKDRPYGEGAYLREISYIYLPLGVILDFKPQGNWHWEATLEYDLFVSGEAKSYLALGTLENHQPSGNGFRLSIDARRRLPFGQFVISPYYRFWKVEDSEEDAVNSSRGEMILYEPQNHSHMIGLLVGFEL